MIAKEFDNTLKKDLKSMTYLFNSVKSWTSLPSLANNIDMLKSET